MTVPSITGSIAQVDSSSASGSQSVTVPTDAELALVMPVWWHWTELTFSCTLGGTSLTQVIWQNNTSHEGSGIFRLSNPSTGSQTFAWTLSDDPGTGATYFIVFLKDVDTTDPITGSATGLEDTQTATSGSFSSSTDDLCICVGASSTDVDAGSGSGQTEQADNSVYNSCAGAVGTKAGVSGTTTMACDMGYSGSICAASIKGSTGGGSGVAIPIAMRHYRNLRT